MRIVAVHEQTVPLVASVRSANISFDTMTASAVAVVTDVMKDGKPLTGLAFDTIGRYGHGGLLRERFIPRLLAADPDRYGDGATIDPARVWDVVMSNEKFGGHGERSGAVGLIDAAVWDLAAKLEDKPLWRYLRDREQGNEDVSGMPIYASGGHYYPNDEIASLCGEVRSAMDSGHTRFKIKVGGADLALDMQRIEAVLATLSPGMILALDGNGMFDLATAKAYLHALADHPIAWLEEPATALDYALNSQIVSETELPIATGENLFSLDDARNLLRYGGMRPDRDMLQFDISASYGLVEYERILDVFAAAGWARERFAPHAGHLFALNCAAGLGLGLAEVAMNTSSLFARITTGIKVENGVAELPEAPGVGFEGLADFDQLFGDIVH